MPLVFQRSWFKRGIVPAARLVAFVSCFSGSLILAYLAIPSSRAVGVPPEIEVLPGTIQDVGAVRQRSVTKARFQLTNRSNALVTITSLSPSCDCTSFDINKRDLRPGETSIISLEYQSGTSRGIVEAMTRIDYRTANNPRERSVSLIVRGQIDPDFEVDPESIEFTASSPLVQHVILRPRHIARLDVLAANPNKPFLTADIADRDDDGSVDVEITFHPDLFYKGAGPAWVSITTDCEAQPTLRVPVRVHAPGSRDARNTLSPRESRT